MEVELSQGDKQMYVGLGGLRAAPAQVWGQVRLVPLVRDEPMPQLRLGLDRKDRGWTSADVPGGRYYSYVPHSMVLSWGARAEEAKVAWETSLGEGGQGRARAKGCPVHLKHGLYRRVSSSAVEFLPLHLAIEGFLSQLMKGPQIAWREYSPEAVRFGAGCVCMESISGHGIGGLAGALSRFEIHQGQCGVLIYVSGRLATAFIVSHPDDYRQMHHSLIHDAYAPLLVSAWPTQEHELVFDALEWGEQPGQKVRDVATLSEVFERAYAKWSEQEEEFVDELFGHHLKAQRLYSAGPFELVRFISQASWLGREAHVGEAIVGEDGHLGYLKTYRLSAQQVQRLTLLRQLEACDWDIKRASELTQSMYPMGLKQKMRELGLGYLLRERGAQR